MVYIIVFLTLFSFVLLIKNYRNHLSWMLMLMIAALDIAIFSLLLYLSKVGYYQYPQNNLFQYDYTVFIKISQLKIFYYTIFKWMNAGISIFVLMMPLLAHFMFYRRIAFDLRTLYWTVGLLALPVFYYWFYVPETGLWFYRLQYVLLDEAQWSLARLLLTAVDQLNYVWIVAYLIYPLYRLAAQYRSSKVVFVRRQLLSLLVVLLLLELFFLAIYARAFGRIAMYSTELNFIREPIRIELAFYYYITLAFVIMVLVIVMLFILFNYRIMDVSHMFQTRMINRNIRDLNKNLRGVFHSFKNTMFSVKIMVEQLAEERGTEKEALTVERLRDFSDGSVHHLSKMINSLKEIKIQRTKLRLADAVGQAITQVYIPSSIKVDTSRMSQNVFAFYDSYHLTEVFVNLLQNAVEAIFQFRKEGGHIGIEVRHELSWAVVRITDNGKGIGKKDRSKIFEPMYTSKTAKTNWGIGLSYSLRVIKAHLGFIYVDSLEEQYTTFEVLLPLAAKRRNEA